MRRLLLTAALLAAAGCGSDPVSGRLSRGQEVVLVAELGSSGNFVVVEPRGTRPDPWKRADYFTVEPGTRAQVESDDAPSLLMKPPLLPDGSKKLDHRGVRLVILDGASKGRIGEVNRCDLRPAPR